MELLQFQPILKTARWGGRLLGERLQKPIGARSDYAESWEICDHGEDQTVVSSGRYAGLTLKELMQKYPCELLGDSCRGEQFPLLIKFLDCQETLSVQVHPNDEQARSYRPDENGKTEAWIVLDARPGSKIYAGLKPEVTREQFLQAIEIGNVADCLHTVTPRVGDCFFVPAGTIHALGQGVLVAEVQQSSDMTFRIHDWNWVDANGVPRQLHLKEAIECIDFERGPVDPVVPTPETNPNGWGARDYLITADQFQIDRYRTRGHVVIEQDNRCRILITLHGSMIINPTDREILCQSGSTVLVPASAPPTTIAAKNGQLVEFLIVTVRDPAKN